MSNYNVAGFSGTPGTINANRTGRYVRVQFSGAQYLVLGEVKVLRNTADVNWLVTDQLGTPRMIFDKTGSLANTKRHDYLPFGEELFGGQGLRTSALGYVADNVRQKFTQKERDIPMEREASQFAVGVMNNIGGWNTDVVEGYEVDAIVSKSLASDLRVLLSFISVGS